MLHSFKTLEGYHKAYLNKFYNQIKTLFTQYNICFKSNYIT